MIELIREVNIINGETNDGFIFAKGGKNINHYAIQAMIKRGCEKVDMLVKTCHKIRKTYVSKLIDSGLNIDAIRRFAGHADEKTTLACYCYNRMTDSQTEDLVESALAKGNQTFAESNQKIVTFLKKKNPEN